MNSPDAEIFVEELSSGKRKIRVEPRNHNFYIHTKNCQTNYPLDLIDRIQKVKGPAWLCDEILREESPDYVQKNLKYDLLSYLDAGAFNGKRLLDFGCGCGASTMNLARMFPFAEIIGIELEKKLLSIASHRAEYYGYKNVVLLPAPEPSRLPADLGFFDHVVLNAVYEHLLPEERVKLLPALWNIIRPGGILFLNQLPFRYFPIEVHTTGGLPFINYLPDRLAHVYARYLSQRNLRGDSWIELLRKGIRGGSLMEIFGILKRCSGEAVLLSPSRMGLRDRIDLWDIKYDRSKLKLIRIFFVLSARVFKFITGITVLPHLSLAIKKEAAKIENT